MKTFNIVENKGIYSISIHGYNDDGDMGYARYPASIEVVDGQAATMELPKKAGVEMGNLK